MIFSPVFYLNNISHPCESGPAAESAALRQTKLSIFNHYPQKYSRIIDRIRHATVFVRIILLSFGKFGKFAKFAKFAYYD